MSTELVTVRVAGAKGRGSPSAVARWHAELVASDAEKVLPRLQQRGDVPPQDLCADIASLHRRTLESLELAVRSRRHRTPATYSNLPWYLSLPIRKRSICAAASTLR